MPKPLVVAMLLALAACTPAHNSDAVDTRLAEEKKQAMERGNEEGAAIAAAARMDALDARVARLETDVATLQTHAKGTDDLKRALAQMTGQPPAAPAVPPAATPPAPAAPSPQR